MSNYIYIQIRINLLLILVLFTTASIAQTLDSPLFCYKYNKCLQYENAQNISSFNWESKLYGMSADITFKQTKVSDFKGILNTKKYQQYYKGIPILGGIYALHYKKNRLIRSTGNAYPFVNVNTQISNRVKWSKEGLQSELLASMKKFDYPIDEESVDFYFVEDGTWIMDEKYPEFSGKYKLVKKIKAYENSTHISLREDVYVDIETGRLINHFF